MVVIANLEKVFLPNKSREILQKNQKHHLSEFLKGVHVRSQPREGRRLEWNPFIILEISAPDDGPYGPYYKREHPC
ncbi:MAG: hypothetical protein ACLFQ6_08820, partial [Candidatus Sumerlaeia bacterium]